MNFEKRVEMVLLFDVLNGNPNGDPDAGNAPRVDPETGYGLVTDVCLKRKIRNFVALTRECRPPYDIYVKERGILADEQRKAYVAVKAEPQESPNDQARDWMCANYFDVRTFGAVMTTGKPTAEELKALNGEKGRDKGPKKEKKLWNCGQVRGPVQLGFARSQSPVLALEHAITRVALTNRDDTGKAEAAESGDEKAASGQMGRKHTIPYALYRAHAFVSPFLAEKTGFSAGDYEVLLEAMVHMFEHDRSAARGEMAMRGFGVFEHEAPLGNAPAHQLFDLIRISGAEAPPRSFGDYRVSGPEMLPAGVSFKWIVEPKAAVSAAEA